MWNDEATPSKLIQNVSKKLSYLPVRVTKYSIVKCNSFKAPYIRNPVVSLSTLDSSALLLSAVTVSSHSSKDTVII